MGLFSKKTSDEEYVRLRTAGINDYNRLVVQNPFAPAEELRDKWMNMYQQIKQVYKLSKKYSDTENDVPVFKAYMDDALNRSNEYSHEIEYIVYRKEFEDVYKQYKELDEDKSRVMSSFGNSYECYQIFEKLYERTEILKSNYIKFSNDNINEYKLETMYNDIAYYFCGFMLNNVFYKTDDGREFNWNFKKACVEKCKKISSKFKEPRFKVLQGNSDFVMGELWSEYAEQLPQESANMYHNRVINCRQTAIYPLSVIEDRKYDGSVTYFDAMEWHYLKMAFWNLYSIYIYTTKNYNKAYELANVMASSQEIHSCFSDDTASFLSDIREEIGYFSKGLFGWKYVK